MPGRGDGQQARGEVQHAARSPVAQCQLVVVLRRGTGQMTADLGPVRVRPRPGRLGQVTEHRDGARRGATGDHAELHRRQVLGLVHHDVPVRAGAASREESRLVEQGQVVSAPGGGTDGRATAPQELLPLLGREQARGVPFQLFTRTTTGRAPRCWGRPRATVCPARCRTPRWTSARPRTRPRRLRAGRRSGTPSVLH